MRFNLNGELLNPEEAETVEVQWLLSKGDPWRMENKANQILNSQKPGALSPEKEDLARKLLEAAAKKGAEPSHRGKRYRMLGELAERRGDKVEAMIQYALAVEFNPKVGCKKALSKIENELRNRKQ